MAKIDVLGLGAGDINQLPFGIYKKLKNMDGVIYTRTLDHPAIKVLKEEGVDFQSFDYLYEEEETFEEVYKRIVSTLTESAKESTNIVYTVPGHPMLGERTVQLLLEQDEVDVNVA